MMLFTKLSRLGFFLVFIFALPNSALAATENMFDDKLKQCRTAYSQARDLQASQQDVVRANQKYRLLMSQILTDLNKQNNEYAATGKSFSAERLTHSIQVMGQLLEMLANPPEAEWSYVY